MEGDKGQGEGAESTSPTNARDAPTSSLTKDSVVTSAVRVAVWTFARRSSTVPDDTERTFVTGEGETKAGLATLGVFEEDGRSGANLSN